MGKTSEKHDENLMRFVERARSLKIRFNPDKLQFWVRKVKHLGHIFAQDEISPDPDRVRSIVEMQHPRNKGELQRF